MFNIRQTFWLLITCFDPKDDYFVANIDIDFGIVKINCENALLEFLHVPFSSP
jgi:hypothetical protein